MPSSPSKSNTELITIVPALRPFLTTKNTIKVAYGGRGSGKSTSICRMLLILGMQMQLRILCCREIQQSIEQSVHQMLVDEMQAMKIEAFYDVSLKDIVGKNGTKFTFEGLKGSEARIKSMAHIDIAWVEEADVVSKTSWDCLYHTLRDGTTLKRAELWISFNPRYSTDYVYETYVIDPPLGAMVIEVNHMDNPWFPDSLRDKMEELKARNFDDYLHIYEGKLKRHLEGAVYAEEIRAAETENRFTKVPRDQSCQTMTFWDLGTAGKTSIWVVQRVGFEIHLIDFIESRRVSLDIYLQKLGALGYAIERHYLPHDAKQHHLSTGMSVYEIMRNRGYKVQIVPRLSISDGINALRMLFPRMWFDSIKCAAGIEQLRNYRYEVKDGRWRDEPLHDDSSHASDALRYCAIALGRNRGDDPDPSDSKYLPTPIPLGQHGWMAL